MYSRAIEPPARKSFFLFGPRGTGKSTWVRAGFEGSLYFDLLESELFNSLTASPQRLDGMIPAEYKGWVVIDEVQRVPEILNEVHRQIESRGGRFVLTGSSARKLKRGDVNLLAGRALTLSMHPLTSGELGADFSLDHSLQFGCLPSVYTEEDPKAYLASYVTTYLKEEVQQEGLTRNLGAFSRFLEAASFSQAAPLNISQVARECNVHRKVVEQYFVILEDLLLAHRIPVFTRKARRRMTGHPKFFLFDAGVFRAIRPRGPLDTPEEIEGAALETLVYQQLSALNAYSKLDYELFTWRTAAGAEVDFVLYGNRGIKAIEVKRADRVRPADLKGLRAFLGDYPMAQAVLLYGGKQRIQSSGIDILPIEEYMPRLLELVV